mmetsp:Transcript_44400/g.71377  ORF Transcript_44400/g.71377 Transcript_44400/m.71377 type:complete len:120 (-) Transcript_44400:55-414(-)
MASQDPKEMQEPSSAGFGLLRTEMLERVNNIRQLQLQMFEEHMDLESQPGSDVAFGGPDDSTDAHGPGGENSGRFKPLGEWFDTKERGIQKLTEKLEKVCDVMKQLNTDAAQHIAPSDK